LPLFSTPHLPPEYSPVLGGFNKNPRNHSSTYPSPYPSIHHPSLHPSIYSSSFCSS
jgi:hypothetical protein